MPPHDSGGAANLFSVLPQYAQGTTPGHITPGDYSISYSAASNAIDDTHPYPSKADQCASANNAGTCVTDAQIQAEIDRVVQSTPFIRAACMTSGTCSCQRTSTSASCRGSAARTRSAATTRYRTSATA